MKKAIILLTLFLSITFFGCGEKCWICKTWTVSPQGTGFIYQGEDTLCDTPKWMIEKLDSEKNDSTDGYDCKVFND